ncbi:ATP-binding protein [Curvibacter sp. APW13]|uniref:ATP-binding protein n=1 Tax=Curvibacter sp. APW13 TaxID=3077236 RepID=UPI0028DD72FE|nr:ATP-binding protein [Curvibacter sp. APW13]MDT8990180.1 ATP-binding protein [Curvibacter sp. APW13]
MSATRSLQARLLLSALAVVAQVWGATAAIVWFDTGEEINELLDAHLAQSAALLVAQESQAEGDDDQHLYPARTKHENRVAFQVFHSGELTLHSSNAPATPLSARDHGFETVADPQGRQWRIYVTAGAEPDVRVLVAERLTEREHILNTVARGVLLPLAASLPLLALALWWAVRRGLGPLRTLRDSLHDRQPQSLAPVHLNDLPAEMRPLVEALNDLLERMARMLESERRFTADAAHELRTPIAAIRMQAQVALGATDDDDARTHALQNTLAGCDRATRLVEQLLTLARLEGQPLAASTPCDIAQLSRRIVAELAPTALARRQNLELDAPNASAAPVNEALAGVLVRNLVDNALRYSPDGAEVHVRVGVEHGSTCFTVDDSGPGLSEAERARLGERFFRVLGSGQAGSGLGWSIVRRIAQVQGAEVQVQHSDTLGGLRVRIAWPAP